MILDGLGGDEEGLRNLPVGATVGGKPGHSKFARSGRVDTAESRSTDWG